jgi:hypothetical protein
MSPADAPNQNIENNPMHRGRQRQNVVKPWRDGVDTSGKSARQLPHYMDRLFIFDRNSAALV